MGRGLSERMRLILSMISTGVDDAHYLTIREVVATFLPFHVGKAGPLDIHGERFGKYHSIYRSTHRTLRLMEKRGLVARYAKRKDGTILWGLCHDKTVSINHLL